jgi:hypothetical protein
MRQLLASLLVLISFSGCQRDPFAAGPAHDELRSRFATELPANLKVVAFDIQASENIGNKVEPNFRTRFSARIQLTADTFLPASTEQNVLIVVRHLESGHNRDVFGVADSTVSGGAWATRFRLDADVLRSLGQPHDSFYAQAKRVVVRGSPDEAVFREAQRRERDAATQAAVTQRQREDQERIDIAQRDRDRIAREAQLASDRLVAQAKAEAELRRIDEQLAAQRRQEEQDRAARAAADAAALAERQELQGDARVREWVNLASPLTGACLGYRTCTTRLRFRSPDTAARSVTVELSAAHDSGEFKLTTGVNWSGETLTGTGTLVHLVRIPARIGMTARESESRETCQIVLTARVSGQLEGTVCRTRLSFTK